MTTETRLTIRATDEDLAHLASIASALCAAGQPFANRTDALRHALRTTAAAMTAVPAAVGTGARD